ncbi:MAG: protocatechuate 3,4-dioxygenase [Pseudomonadota bacterium]
MNDPASRMRRKILRGLALMPVPMTAIAASSTPPAAEGPFYPTRSMRFDDVDNDLVRIAGVVREAGGEIVRLSGKVFDRSGDPVSGAQVEIWQCDVNGRYLHRADHSSIPRDAGFQGFGVDQTDQAGRYQFRTIKPVPYTGRTPHIHVKIRFADQDLLTTQIYLDHPQNQRDWLYRRIPAALREELTMRFSNAQDEPEAIVNFRL